MENNNTNPYSHLHAYWRMPYIKSLKFNGGKQDPFENLDSADEKSNHILIKKQHCCILLNKFPYNSGHLLVLPYRSIPDIEDLEMNEKQEFFDLIIIAKSILKKSLQPDGFNIGINLGESSGAGIPMHLHCHVVPRWNGDNNFMPVIANTRVLPESLDEMWNEMKKYC